MNQETERPNLASNASTIGVSSVLRSLQLFAQVGQVMPSLPAGFLCL